MSFNIRYGTARDGDNHWDKRKSFLADTIKAFNPDLLGTQETLAFQRDWLLQQLDGYETFAAGREDGKEKGEMAALFYRKARFDRLDGGHFWLSPTPEQPGSKGWDAALPRIVTWVKLRDRTAPDAKPLLFLNTHFDHLGVKARTESARLIRDRLPTFGRDCTLVVTGDFNAGEDSDPYRALFGEVNGQPSPLTDTYRALHPQRGGEEGTFNGFVPTSTRGPRIDWIACSTDWTVKAAAIDHTQKEGRVPSDHFPVTAILAKKLQR
jgi:endonuclease/exonuclease/phosphatase family metal-dependent hydrolase